MRLKDPILFIPGVIAPYQLGNWHYFNNLNKFMQSKYYIAEIDSWGTLAERSLELKSYIDEHITENKIHILTHSKGGLDLEYLFQTYPEYRDRVLSHTSLSCPYGGSIIAFIFWILFFPLELSTRGKKVRATLRELFPKKRTKEIKQNYPEYCILGYLGIFTPTYPLFFITNIFILLSEGANDGFVSVKSSQKGEVLKKYKTDHIGLIGHFYTRKRQDIFENILKTIALKINENEK